MKFMSSRWMKFLELNGYFLSKDQGYKLQASLLFYTYSKTKNIQMKKNTVKMKNNMVCQKMGFLFC